MKQKLTIGIAAAAVIAVVAAVLFKQRVVSVGESASRSPIPATLESRSFTTWDDFLSASTPSSADREKVVFIGVDGAAWNVIDPLIERGDLPNFRRLKEGGCYGVLRSVECYVSPPAWVTMMTGYLPEHTAVYTFGHWDPDIVDFQALKANHVVVPSVWDVASFAGKRTAVVNVPITYPVHAVNGIMVSGLLTPSRLADRVGVEAAFVPYTGNLATIGNPRSFSPVLAGGLDHGGSRYDFHLIDTADDRQTLYDRVVLTITPESGGAPAVHSFPLGPYSDWIRIGHVGDGRIDNGWCQFRIRPSRTAGKFIIRFSDTLFDAASTDVQFTYPDSLGGILGRRFGRYFPSKFLDADVVPGFAREAVSYAEFLRDYDDWDLFMFVFTQTDNLQHLLGGSSELTHQVYRTIDAFLGRLIDELPDNTTLIVASDHGFKEYTYGVDLNKVFEQIGLLSYTGRREVDHANTVAFHNLWCVYFNDALLNREELARRKIPVPPGATAREAVIQHIQRACGKLIVTDSRTKERHDFSVEFSRVDPNAVGFAPDLIVNGAYQNHLVEFWNFKRPQEAPFRRLGMGETWNHTREGIFIAYGRNVKRGYAAPAQDIQDITPTMLYLLGVPTGSDVDGKVMADVLEPGVVSEHPNYVVEEYAQIPRREKGRDVDDDESFEKKLRSLGYVR